MQMLTASCWWTCTLSYYIYRVNFIYLCLYLIITYHGHIKLHLPQKEARAITEASCKHPARINVHGDRKREYIGVNLPLGVLSPCPDPVSAPIGRSTVWAQPRLPGRDPARRRADPSAKIDLNSVQPWATTPGLDCAWNHGCEVQQANLKTFSKIDGGCCWAEAGLRAFANFCEPVHMDRGRSRWPQWPDMSARADRPKTVGKKYRWSRNSMKFLESVAIGKDGNGGLPVNPGLNILYKEVWRILSIPPT